jgi:hypothetical protein
MPNATLRANARPMPKNKRPPRDMAALDTAIARVIPDPGAPAALVDPIFAAIERHRTAWAPYEAALKRTGPFVGPPPQALEDAKNAAGDAEMAAANELLATTPTTLVGLGELLRYAAEMDPGSVPDSPQDFKAFVAALARSPVFPRTASHDVDDKIAALWGRIVRQYSKAEIEAGMAEFERLFPRPGDGRAAQ